jgi:hypothetical protein
MIMIHVWEWRTQAPSTSSFFPPSLNHSCAVLKRIKPERFVLRSYINASRPYSFAIGLLCLLLHVRFPIHATKCTNTDCRMRVQIPILVRQMHGEKKPVIVSHMMPKGPKSCVQSLISTTAYLISIVYIKNLVAKTNRIATFRAPSPLRTSLNHGT